MVNAGQLNQAFDLLEYEDELEEGILRHQAEADQLRAECWELKEKVKDFEHLVNRQDDLIRKISGDFSELYRILHDRNHVYANPNVS
jgi:hypothetical protein